jgi:uncharacterized membrane protein
MRQSFFKRPEFILLCLLLLGLALRLVHFDRSLWFDEISYSLYDSLEHLKTRIIKTQPPPFYPSMMFVWTRLAGDGEVALRIPPLVFSLMSIAVVFFFTRKYLGQTTAVVASGLLTISPVHIWYSKEATTYSFSILIFLIIILAFYKLTEPEVSKRWYYIYALAWLVGAMTHSFISVHIFLFLILSLFSTNKYKVLLINVGILLWIGLYVMMKMGHHKMILTLTYLRPFTFEEWWLLFFNWFSLGKAWHKSWGIERATWFTNIPLVIAHMGFFILWIRGMILLIKKNDFHTRGIVCFLCYLPLGILTAGFLGFNKIYIERYLVILLPLFYIVLAYGLVQTRNMAVKISALVIILTITFLSLNKTLSQEKCTVYKPNPDYRSAARYLAQEPSDSGPLEILVGRITKELSYYQKQLLRNDHIDFSFHLRRIQDPKNINNKTFYVIKDDFWPGTSENLIKNIKEHRRIKKVSEKKFTGVTVYKFKRW